MQASTAEISIHMAVVAALAIVAARATRGRVRIGWLISRRWR